MPALSGGQNLSSWFNKQAGAYRWRPELRLAGASG